MHKPASNDAVTSLHDLSAVDLLAGFRAKQFSPSEVLEDVLAHIAMWEPHIKALYAFDPDGARTVAKASTERWQKGEPTGALDGVPVTIKDNIATKGVPVPLGAASVKLVPATVDAPPAARLREAGAVIFSKTTMPDYGMLSSGLSSFHPLTPAVRAPAPVPRAQPVTARCISARISAARCGCRPAGAAWSR
jgi:aspartyl-tRNA(Asn)/glutamyl-tRNA(Gln) amidotransferase subunit A